MKNYELIEELLKLPARADICCFNLETSSMDNITTDPEWVPVCMNGPYIQMNFGEKEIPPEEEGA
jgi:hypothetical protein